MDDKEKQYEDVCYMCRRPESVAGKLMRIPNNICICQECMQKTFDTINNSGMPYGDFMNHMNPAFMGFANMQEVPERQKLKKKQPKEDEKEKEVPELKIDELQSRLDEEIDEEYIMRIAREKLNYRLPEEIIFYNDLSK